MASQGYVIIAQRHTHVDAFTTRVEIGYACRAWLQELPYGSGSVRGEIISNRISGMAVTRCKADTVRSNTQSKHTHIHAHKQK